MLNTVSKNATILSRFNASNTPPAAPNAVPSTPIILPWVMNTARILLGLEKNLNGFEIELLNSQKNSHLW